MPRDLTEAERARLVELDSKIDTFVAEGFGVFVDLFQKIGSVDLVRIVNEPDYYLPQLESWLSRQNWPRIDEQSRRWLGAQIGFYMGEVLNKRHQGAWTLNRDPDSPLFLHYVVTLTSEADAIDVEPFETVLEYTRDPEAISFSDFIRSLETRLGLRADRPESL